MSVLSSRCRRVTTRGGAPLFLSAGLAGLTRRAAPSCHYVGRAEHVCRPLGGGAAPFSVCSRQSGPPRGTSRRQTAHNARCHVGTGSSDPIKTARHQPLTAIAANWRRRPPRRQLLTPALESRAASDAVSPGRRAARASKKARVTAGNGAPLGKGCALGGAPRG